MQGNLTVAKSITISGDGTEVIGTITISGASAVVTLQGLKLTGGNQGGGEGIRINVAAVVHIENCTIAGYSHHGIQMLLYQPVAIDLYVSDTVSRDNGGVGLDVENAGAQVVVENSRFEGNAGDGLYLHVAKSNIIRSVVSGNGSDGIVVSGGKANITETTAADNTVSGVWVTGGAAILASSVASGNSSGLDVNSGSAAVITDSALTANTTGAKNYGSLTLVNTVIAGNSTAISNSGSLYTRQNNTVGGVTSGNAKIPYSSY